uniref:Reverse transcriptase domain-containing protein n=1 Tax=Triticum urartu TaxID=4572 RepID=A0A8R7R958_TRIUA
MPLGKAPGPDGFTAEFLRSAWDVIKHDFCAVFDKHYALNRRGFQRLNEALLTLIPKKQDAASLFDYCPISLIHLIVKLFAKALSLRLAPHLGKLVSTNQSAFIAGQSIHENFLLVQQTARLRHNLKMPRMLLKLDIARAFDSVAWPFLLDTVRHLGFGNGWCEWISILLS